MKIDRAKFNNKLLFIDIETSLIEAYTHYIGSKVTLTNKQIKKDKKVICVCFKAEGWSKAKSFVWDENQDDRELLKQTSELLSQYPVVVAQNGDAFDIKVLKGRMWIQGVKPCNNIMTLDTLKLSRSNMKLTSHKLDYKSKVIGHSGKLEMHMDDWIRVQDGNKTALKKMVDYCKVDVDELQDVFWSILPYADKLPLSMSVLLSDDREGCPTCGSQKRCKNGLRPSKTGILQRWYCKDCGHDWTDSRSLKTTERIEHKKNPALDVWVSLLYLDTIGALLSLYTKV